MFFGKLIRDKIPADIKKSGNFARTHTASDEEYFDALVNKAKEEINELASAPTENMKIEEMADVLEVIHAIGDHLKLDPKMVEQTRLQKREQKGGFKEKLILDEVNYKS